MSEERPEWWLAYGRAYPSRSAAVYACAGNDSDHIVHVRRAREVETLRSALADLRAGIDEHATDTVWYSKIETACDRITAILGDTGLPDREPPEPDGECFRGGEAAAYSAEQQARIQRELK